MSIPAPYNVPLGRALWSQLDGTLHVLKGSLRGGGGGQGPVKGPLRPNANGPATRTSKHAHGGMSCACLTPLGRSHKPYKLQPVSIFAWYMHRAQGRDINTEAPSQGQLYTILVRGPFGVWCCELKPWMYEAGTFPDPHKPFS